ncbi:MAG: nucleoside phosphorylase [Chlorobiaceae bacterium]|nr:nucleoside phosphorylase [Chlorobiaceae bacterium]NTV61883.1 nucleoside phosphorylase [Chlorobiaceae bacterium]
MPVKDSSITSARRYIDFLLMRKGQVELQNIPGQCIINYLPDVSDSMKALYPYRSMTLGITNPMQLDVFSPDTGRPFAMSHGLHGSPMAAVQLEELIALGCEDFLVIGPAGHPTATDGPELELGELLLATSAWIFEGTSPHYGEHKQSKPSAEAVRHLISTLQDLELHCRKGAVATTDALYRETGPFLRKLLDRQILAIEMELSALFTVAQFHGKSIAGLLFISDLVGIDGSWHIAPSPKVYRTVVRQLTDIVLAFIKQ